MYKECTATSSTIGTLRFDLQRACGAGREACRDVCWQDRCQGVGRNISANRDGSIQSVAIQKPAQLVSHMMKQLRKPVTFDAYIDVKYCEHDAKLEGRLPTRLCPERALQIT